MSIPRVINLTWMQGWSQLPDKFRSNIQSIIDKNPGYKIRYWDEHSLRDAVRLLGPEYLAKWNSFSHMHQRVDFGRYVALYVTGGGISTDVDVVALKGFDSTPNIDSSNFVVSYNSSNAFENYIKNGRRVALNNATILVGPNNQILKGLIDHIMGLSCEVNQDKESCIQSTTGPREFTEYLDQYKDEITVLDHRFFEPCQGNSIGCTIPEQAILDHQHEASWVSDRNKKIAQAWYWMKEHWLWMVGIIGFIILVSFSRKTKTV